MKKAFSLILTLLLCFSFTASASANAVNVGVSRLFYEKRGKPNPSLI